MPLSKKEYEQMSSEILELSVSVWDETLEYCEDGIKLDDLWLILDKYLKAKEEKLGIEISEIINQDGDDKTDGECIDEIINLLDKYGFYKKRV
ncbi:MAG: hypothetical protein RLZZ196_1815 [Bacteroidota bacterium]|jgi:hypothetical protein